MKMLSQGIRYCVLNCMCFAEHIVLCSTSRKVKERNLEDWRRVLGEKGLRISRKKTEYFYFTEQA